ncbi:MAG: hypothetical protein ABIW03_07855 [Sphingomicrobium sp.]
MAQLATSKPTERLGALTAVLVLHALALALVLMHRNSAQRPATGGPLHTVMLEAAAAEQSPPPPPTLPSKIVREVRPETQLAVSTEAAADPIAGPPGGCGTAERVRLAILADPAAIQSVLLAPPETRSIADAIVIWNVGWSTVADTDIAPLVAARLAVERSLASVESACLDEPVAGPRLIPIPAQAGMTTFLVFGSGNWTWRNVAQSLKPFEPAASMPQQNG